MDDFFSNDGTLVPIFADEALLAPVTPEATEPVVDDLVFDFLPEIIESVGTEDVPEAPVFTRASMLASGMITDVRTATVTQIIDGDTFLVSWDNGYQPPAELTQPDRIRISGIDTNEIGKDGGISEAFADEATARLAELLPIGTTVELEARSETSNTLGRPVRHVYTDDASGDRINVAKVLIQEGLGLAVSYDFEPDYRSEYFTASEEAQVAEVGMWEPGASGGDPSTWPAVAMIVNFDAAGDDNQNLNDEYIQIRNEGPGQLDITNWTARSSARLDGATIQVPFGTVLDADDVYRIHTGSGLNTATDMYLGLSEAIFDNTGDVVYLRDPDLNVRATQLWPATITADPLHSIVIDDVQYDAPGFDDINPNGEWVVIRNAGAETVDLTDWRLKDDGFDYAFKDGETLAAGEQLRIFVGSGTDSGSDRYWGNDAGILNNDGARLRIWSPDSQEVDEYSWGNPATPDVTSSENIRGALEVHANFNASGNDRTNPNGEWVALRNTSSTAIDLSGFVLRSDQYTYTLAAGTAIDADQNLRVKIGSGNDTSSTLYWGNSTGILANGGDSVELVDASGEILLQHAWGSEAYAGPNTGLTDYGLVIDEVNFDAPGNDGTNPNGEWFTIRNTSAAEQNLQNWKIVVGPYQLVSVADRPILPGEVVTVYIGSGTNTEDTIYWGKSSGILYNSGSRAIELLAPDRDVVDAHSWGSAQVDQQGVAAAISLTVNYDAVGIDSDNPNGEWINLTNGSSSTVSLDGYHLYTDGTSYQFDTGDTIDAGERMRVYLGDGNDDGLDRYANGALNELSNTADEVLLRPDLSAGTASIFAYTSDDTTDDSPFEITFANYDAVGSDTANPNGEWVEITNTSTKTVDLRDWRIQYATATFFDFNESVEVAAGATIRVYMGEGTDTATEFYWGNQSGILSNTQGTLTLQSDMRAQADTFSWPSINNGQPIQSIVIDDVQYNAPGDDGTNPNGEWIVIRNAGAGTADLEGYRVNNGASDYVFAAGETLEAGEQLRIFVGSGTDGGSDRYWGNASGILGNGGDTVRVLTDNLYTVDAFSWGVGEPATQDVRGAIEMFANFNAAGNDTNNPNGEWVALRNTGSAAIDLSGYKLENDGSIYTFAGGTMLDADQNLRVKIGSGNDTSSTLYWGNSTGILANGGDSVELVDASGEILLQHAWGSEAYAGPNTGLTDYGLVIDEVNFDAPGNDGTNPNGEWFTIRNTSAAEQNLQNWKIVVGPYQLVSVADRPILPGEVVTVYIGSGTNTEDTIYWGKSSGILYNSGSRAIELLAPDRDVVDAHSWGSAQVDQQGVAAAIDMSINYDAVGSDGSNLNGEWINLVNHSSSTVSLDGYHLYTDGTTYTFDAGDMLGAGDHMRVYRGTGSDSDAATGDIRYANGSLNEFSNTADEVELRRSDTGGAASIFAYTSSDTTDTSPFEISAVNYDAVGSDAANPNGEWIEITNTSGKAADLRDWRIQYATATFFDFGGSVPVAAGATIRIYMGSGTDSATELYWGNQSGILSNSAGTVVLQSDVRERADTFDWS